MGWLQKQVCRQKTLLHLPDLIFAMTAIFGWDRLLDACHIYRLHHQNLRINCWQICWIWKRILSSICTCVQLIPRQLLKAWKVRCQIFRKWKLKNRRKRSEADMIWILFQRTFLHTERMWRDCSMKSSPGMRNFLNLLFCCWIQRTIRENWTILCIRLQESPRNIIAIYGDFNISRNRDLWHHYHWEWTRLEYRELWLRLLQQSLFRLPHRNFSKAVKLFTMA